MADPVQKALTHLMEQREKVFAQTQARRAMGGFDANAETIMVLLTAISAIMDYLVLKGEAEKRGK